jgi:hypothetical protein
MMLSILALAVSASAPPTQFPVRQCGEICVIQRHIERIAAMSTEEVKNLRHPTVERLPFPDYYRSYVDCHIKVIGRKPFSQKSKDAEIDKKLQNAFLRCANERAAGDNRMMDAIEASGEHWESLDHKQLARDYMRAFLITEALAKFVNSERFGKYLESTLSDVAGNDSHAPNQ